MWRVLKFIDEHKKYKYVYTSKFGVNMIFFLS